MNWQTPWRKSFRLFYGLGLTGAFPPGHRLFRKRLKELGRRADCDDVLYSIKDEYPKVAVVHLTYKKENDPQWPHTTVYDSLEDFFEKRMIPESRESSGKEKIRDARSSRDPKA